MFYDRLLEICNNKGLKITPLVKSCGGSTGSIGNWKNGATPNCDIVIKLAAHLNVSIDYLLTGKEPTAISLPSLSSAQNTALTSDENTLIELFRKLPNDEQHEFIGELRGYVKYMSKSSAEPLKKIAE